MSESNNANMKEVFSLFVEAVINATRAAARADERERCAKIVEDFHDYDHSEPWSWPTVAAKAVRKGAVDD